MRCLGCLGLLLMPSLLAAQEGVQAGIDSLLTTPEIDADIAGLGERFIGNVILLVPDLPPEDIATLTQFAERAFDPAVVRSDVASIMAAQAASAVVADLLRDRGTGASAELGAIAESYEPPLPLNEYVAGLGAPPRERLQLMAGLAQERGDSDLALLLDEAVGGAAHRLVAELGGAMEPFATLSDEQYDDAYRQRTLSLAFALLHGLEPASDDLLRRVIDEYGSQAHRWFVDAYAVAMSQAVLVAGQRVAAFAFADEPTPEAEPADSGMPCRGRACGLVVEWEGRPPTTPNRRFGAAGDLEARVLEHLLGAGYRLVRGLNTDGLTLRLRPKTMMAMCDVMSGTNNTRCEAIDQVRVEFLGSDPDFESPGGFNIRNRCGADGVMDVDDVSMLVALRLDYALTTYPGDERAMPRC